MDFSKWKKKKGEHSGSNYSSSNNIQSDEGSEGYGSFDVLMVVKKVIEDGWVMDFGCSFHMTRRKDYFYDLKEFGMGIIRLGDDRECEIHLIGSVIFRLTNGTHMKIKDFRTYLVSKEVLYLWILLRS